MRGLSQQNYKLFRQKRRSYNRRARVAFWGLFVASLLITLPQVFAAAPEWTELDEGAKRAKIQELYRKQIPLLEQYVEKYPNGPRAGQTMFRLGEAYFESAKFYELSGHIQQAEEYKTRAIKTLELLKNTQPTYERLDEALLVLASAHREAGNEDKAGAALAYLAERFPNSKVMEDAAFLLGDHYFAKGNNRKARQFYNRASKNEKTKAYANYKLAWVARREGQPALALKHFEAAYKWSGAKGSGFDYREDVAREIVWPALEVYRAKKIVSYLGGLFQDSEILASALDYLSRGLSDKGEYDLASRIYGVLIERFPEHSKLDEWVSQQLDAEEKLGRSGRIIQLVSQLGGVNQDSPKVRSKVYKSAKKYHALGQAEKDPKKRAELYDQAIAYYKAYTSLGTDAEKSFEVQFFLGEALYERGRYEEAITAYEIAARNENDRQLEAAWNWYLTAEKIAPGFKYNGDKLRPTTNKDEQFLEAAKYVSRMSAMPEPKRRKASYQSARLVYQLNDYERALPIFQYLADKFPGSKEAELSAQLVLDIYNLKKDYDQVAAFARKYKDQADSSVRAELSLLEQKALFKKIQEEENQAKALPESQRASALDQVGQRYVEFVRSYPRSSLVDSALWAGIQLHAAAASLRDDQSFNELRKSFMLLVKEYPRSKHVNKAVKLMADYVAFAQPEESITRQFSNYRAAWMNIMKQKPSSKRGPLGMVLYKMSDESEQRALEREFSKWPMSSENSIANAYGRMPRVVAKKESYDSISLNSLKKLQTNTKKKLAALSQLEDEVASVVELGVAEPAVRSLNLLANAYDHMALSLKSAPRPNELSGADLEKYVSAVNERAAVYERKSRQTKESAERTANKAGISPSIL